MCVCGLITPRCLVPGANVGRIVTSFHSVPVGRTLYRSVPVCSRIVGGVSGVSPGAAESLLTPEVSATNQPGGGSPSSAVTTSGGGTRLAYWTSTLVKLTCTPNCTSP